MENKEIKDENGIRELFKTVLTLLAIIIVVFGFTHFVAQRTVVSGMSMYNSLSDGDNLIVNKLEYRTSDPERFDVIVFPVDIEGQENVYYIKRVIGLPGEEIFIGTDSKIYINGRPLKEKYGTETLIDRGLAAEPIILGEDEYFCLGDNRNNSIDSRFSSVGNIKRDKIIGKAWLRVYPFDEIGLVDNIK